MGYKTKSELTFFLGAIWKRTVLYHYSKVLFIFKVINFKNLREKL